jgi:hypothetical protein
MSYQPVQEVSQEPEAFRSARQISPFNLALKLCSRSGLYDF